MNKFKIILICLLIFTLSPSYAFLSKKEVRLYHRLHKQYSWLSKDLYHIINYESKQVGMDPRLLIAVINKESQGRNVISKRNKNKTRDYGYCQINSAHSEKGKERELLNPQVNINKGVNYLNLCIKKYPRLDEAIRMYNAGINSSRDKYNNWSYVRKIIDDYYISLNIKI